MADRIPAYGFPIGGYIQEELEARGWDTMDLAMRMGGATERDIQVDCVQLDFLLAMDEAPEEFSGLLPQSDDFLDRLGAAFGQDPQTWKNLQAAWFAFKNRSN